MSTQRMTIAGAINAGLRRILETNPRSLLIGEDIGKLGGVYRVTDGLQEDFGEDRVADSPLAESGIIGTSIGMAMRGYRPLAEIQFDGFIFPAFNQITTQLSKMYARTRGKVTLPVVIRVPYGGGIGSVEHHSESPEALFAHTAGIRIMTPSSPHDAYWMIQEACELDDPVIFFEPKRRYWLRGEVDTQNREAAPDQAMVVREGTDATLLAWGPVVPTALAAAAALETEDLDIEVIDLRSLNPIDFDAIEASVAKTGRLVIAHEAPTFQGLGAEIAARIGHRCFYALEAPIERVGGYHMPYPPSRVETDYLPNIDRIVDALDRTFEH